MLFTKSGEKISSENSENELKEATKEANKGKNASTIKREAFFLEFAEFIRK
eukprot:Pgem_evm1s17313